MSKGDKDHRTPTLFDTGPPTTPEPLIHRGRPVYTEHKAKLVARYLYYFVMITKNGVYLDGFAGPQSQKDDETDWSARLVLESEPRWLTRFFLFEQDPDQASRIHSMWNAQPPRNKVKKETKRHVEITTGDFNALLPEFLSRRPIKSNAATFALLDQRTFECRWRSVVALAKYKPEGEEKIEQFYFLPNWWLDRALAATKDDQLLADWWGNDGWGVLRGMPGLDRANLVAARFRNELGYKSVKAWPIYQRPKAGGGVMYYMIHATDHPEAPKLMSRAYRKVLDALEPRHQFEFWFKNSRAEPIAEPPTEVELDDE